MAPNYGTVSGFVARPGLSVCASGRSSALARLGRRTVRDEIIDELAPKPGFILDQWLRPEVTFSEWPIQVLANATVVNFDEALDVD
jgi:hypothetical protein